MNNCDYNLYNMYKKLTIEELENFLKNSKTKDEAMFYKLLVDFYKNNS